MNNIFDIKRFGSMLKHDGMSYFKSFGWTLVILWILPIIFWGIAYVSMEVLDTGTITNRGDFISKLVWLTLIIVPSRFYKNVNDSRKGILYAMTPISSFEKFLSMFVYCVVLTPIVYIVGAVVVDTILALKPGTNPYDGFIFKDLFSRHQMTDPVNKGIDGQIVEYVLNKNKTLMYIVLVLCVSSIFMFTNMLFKKRKLSKTIGVLALVGIILSVVIVRLVIGIDFESLSYYTDEELVAYGKNIIDVFYSIGLSVSFILSVVLFYFTYRKIKKQTY